MSMIKTILLSSVTILSTSTLFSLPAWASEAVQVKPGPAMLQTLAGLAIVLALIFALAWLSKRLSGGAIGNHKFMKIIAVQPLGAREKILLVEVGDQQMMLGVTPGRITMLHVFDEPVVHVPMDTVPGNLAARSAAEFSKKLHEFLNQGNKS